MKSRDATLVRNSNFLIFATRFNQQTEVIKSQYIQQNVRTFKQSHLNQASKLLLEPCNNCHVSPSITLQLTYL